MSKYTEIFKLKEMLESEKIPFEWRIRKTENGFQICYPNKSLCDCSVIEHQYSYGNEKDLLEIMGLMTKKEENETQDSVLGYLTAEDVFKRIKKHWKKHYKKRDSRSKYKQGRKIESIEDFEKSTASWFKWHNRTKHRKVLECQQYRALKQFIQSGYIYEADLIEECKQ